MTVAIALLAGSSLHSAPQASGDGATKLEAAAHSALVAGDLHRAVSQYEAILAEPATARSVAAEALLQMGICLERLGKRKEARAAYGRVLKEYGDQGKPLAEVRRRLAAWSDAPPGPRNIVFEEGRSGAMPPGWTGRAELRRSGCRQSGGCAVVTGELMQRFNAAAYRGKTIRLRAWVRLEEPQQSAELRLRILGKGSPESGERSVASQHWTPAEIVCEASRDAEYIEFGIGAKAAGRAWVDGFALEIVPPSEVAAARTAIQAMYTRLDVAADYADTAAIAAIRQAHFRGYEDNAQFLSNPLPPEFVGVETTIMSFRFAVPGAVAVVRSQFYGAAGKPAAVTVFRDTWTYSGPVWSLKERTFVSGHYLGSRTDPDTARLVAADLKQIASPLATPQAGHTFYDLAPVGNAIANARIVAIGAAAGGVREIFEIEHRLLEYLVKEKGFTVFAAHGDPAQARLIDEYLQTGGGAPEPALANLKSWAWDAREALEMVRWMRDYNMRRGERPRLHFAAFDSPAAAMNLVQHTFAGRKMVLSASNLEVGLSPGSTGSELREQFGPQFRILGTALYSGELRAPALLNGEVGRVATHSIPATLQGTGDWVLNAAGMPLFFLDLTTVPPMTTLGFWLSESHLFLTALSVWNRDDPENHLHRRILPKTFDALIFVKEGHAVRPLEANRAEN